MAAFMLRADPCGPFHPLSTSIATKRNALTPSDHHAVFSRSYKPHNSPPPQLRPSFKERPICSACISHGCLKRIELYQQGSSVNWHISPAWKQRRAWAFRKYHTLEVRNHSNGMAANKNRKTEAKVPEQAEAEVDVGAVEARAGLGRRARKQRRSKGEELQVGNRDKSQTIPKRKKDWQVLTFAEMAWEGIFLSWLNKLVYVLLFVLVGAWIIFRFIGPALGLYQLDSLLIKRLVVLDSSLSFQCLI